MLRKLLPQGLGTAQGSSLLPILLCCREQWQEELRWDSVLAELWQTHGFLLSPVVPAAGHRSIPGSSLQGNGA